MSCSAELNMKIFITSVCHLTASTGCITSSLKQAVSFKDNYIILQSDRSFEDIVHFSCRADIEFVNSISIRKTSFF